MYHDLSYPLIRLSSQLNVNMLGEMTAAAHFPLVTDVQHKLTAGAQFCSHHSQKHLLVLMLRTLKLKN